jgi:transposase
MHQEHRSGETAYLDWAGKMPLCITNPDTGEQSWPQFFVCILGASQYTYAEACPSQKQRHWTLACQHALEYFEGVPEALVPDAYKGAVTTACRHEPVTNRTFQDFADHYGTVILPARPYRPKDKSLVEGMVRILYTRLFAPLRNRTFHSLDELNEALWELLESHNRQKMQRMEVSRHDLWLKLDRPLLKPLPALAYEYRQYKIQKVPNTYHIRISEDDHYYSVPWQLHGKEVTVIYSGRTVEVYHDNLRQAFHRRIHDYGWSTNHDHMPDHHRFIASWSPGRITSWASSVGPSVAAVCGLIMDRFKYPEHGYRTCMGIIKLQDKWGKDRLDRACSLALQREILGYRAVKTILETNQDKLAFTAIVAVPHVVEHENLRGQAAYS